MSSNNVVLRVSNVGKCFHIYDRPQDRLKQSIVPRIQRIFGLAQSRYMKEFWALREISFEVKKGETVGIIGRNGSGKSTLLQILCGTLAPTTGTVDVMGRVAALLELGAGFNPEFTGRENVYMNATVLGLTNEQINAKFDDIAAFADIGEFIEQPVKTYSSGMYVRLAFAVIAHVDAEILVVDEALSVGDAIFTQKCMRFIRSFQERGTLFFVSHDMGAVQNLCKTAIWLGNGRIMQTGLSKAVAEAYLKYTLQETYGDAVNLKATSGTNPATIEAESAPAAPPTITRSEDAPIVGVQPNLANATGWKTGGAEILSVEIFKLDGRASDLFTGGERVNLVVKARANMALPKPILGFLVKDRLGQDLFGENTLPFTALEPRSVQAGATFFAEFTFTLPMLPNGHYAVMASVADGDLHNNVQHHYLHDALIINVFSSKVRWGLVGIPFERVTLQIAV